MKRAGLQVKNQKFDLILASFGFNHLKDLEHKLCSEIIWSTANLREPISGQLAITLDL